MSTFKKYLNIINEGGYSGTNDDPQEIVNLNKNEIKKLTNEDFFNSKVFYDFCKNLTSSLNSELVSKNEGKGKLTFNPLKFSEIFEKDNAHLLEPFKNNFINSLKKPELNSELQLLKSTGNNEKLQQNLKFLSIEKKTSNKIEIRFEFNGNYEKLNKVTIGRGVSEERGLVNKEPKARYYQGAGPASNKGGKPPIIFQKEEIKEPNKPSSYTDGISFRNPGKAPGKGGINELPYNHIRVKRKKKK